MVLLLAWVAVPGDLGASRLARAKPAERARTVLARLRLRPLRAPRRRQRRGALVRPGRTHPVHGGGKLSRATAARNIRRAIAPARRVSDLSIATLLLSGARGVGTTARTRVPLALDAVTGIGGAALAIASIVDYRRALDGPGKVDAAHGLAWGVQSLASIGARVTNTGWLDTASAGLGIAGGTLQTGVGLYRLKDGLARRDRRVTILGALDVVAGTTWALSTATVNPVAFGVFLTATGVRVVYANAAEWKRAGGHVLRGARRLMDVVSSRPTREAEQGAE